MSTDSVRVANVSTDSVRVANVSTDSVRVANVSTDSVRVASVSTDSVRVASVSSVRVASVSADSVRVASVSTDSVRVANVSTDSVRVANVSTDSVRVANVSTDSVRVASVSTDSVRVANVSADSVRVASVSADSVRVANVSADSVRVASVSTDSVRVANVSADSVQIDTGLIDAGSFLFDKEVLQTPSDKNSFLSQYRALEVKQKVRGFFVYRDKFSANNLVTSWVIDPLKGFGILLETEMNDMLENYLIKGGVMFTTNFKNTDLFLNYDYLKERVDYSMRYEREVIYVDHQLKLAERYVKNTFQLGASYPFNIRTKIAVKPFFTETRYDDLFPQTSPISSGFKFDESVKNRFGGVSLELVYDNSIVKELNYREGFRGKVSLKHHRGLTDNKTSFSNLSIDLRHNQKIHRQIVLAGRLFYGRFFGDNPQKYLLGGSDNWLFNKSANDTNSPLNLLNAEKTTTKGSINSQLLFAEFVTSLRGFDYGSLYGTNALLANLELRIPIVRYFHNGPISSNFFRNLQFTGFYDIGSSWTHGSPFSESSNIDSRTEKPPGSPFQYTIIDHKNPWIYSYGIGFRTVLLGYYMKFDLAWPVENFIVKSPRLFATLGFDF